MSSLLVSDPTHDLPRRERLTRLLHDYDLPLSGFTETPAPGFPADMPQSAFLRAASVALLIPGQPLPMDLLLAHLPASPLPANVLRRHLFLRLSLMPYLRPGRQVTQLSSCFLLGDDLLVVPVTPQDTVDAFLPPGVWTELNGSCHAGRLREMRGYNETPVLVRENTLLPVSMNGQSLAQTTPDDTDRLTLHWFQPAAEAICTLADGTWYRAHHDGATCHIDTNAVRPFHLILHKNGSESLIR